MRTSLRHWILTTNQQSPAFLHLREQVERGAELPDAAIRFLERTRKTELKRATWIAERYAA